MLHFESRLQAAPDRARSNVHSRTRNRRQHTPPQPDGPGEEPRSHPPRIQIVVSAHQARASLAWSRHTFGDVGSHLGRTSCFMNICGASVIHSENLRVTNTLSCYQESFRTTKCPSSPPRVFRRDQVPFWTTKGSFRLPSTVWDHQSTLSGHQVPFRATKDP